MKSFKLGQKVIVNTGGKDYPATISMPNARDISGNIRTYILQGSDEKSYCCKFENNTAQYIPAKYIKTV
jgi:hypothetical protein